MGWISRLTNTDTHGLHGGVHRYALKLSLTHGLGLHSHRDRFGQKGLQIIRPDPLAPSGHRGAVEGSPMLKMRLAAEGLEVRVLQPGRAGLFVRQSLHVLEQVQPGHKARRQPAPTLRLVEMRPESVIKLAPVDQGREPDQLMRRVNDRLQRTAEQIV